MANSVSLSPLPPLFTCSSPLLHHNTTFHLNFQLRKHNGLHLKSSHNTTCAALHVNASASAMPLSVKPDDLVDSILSKDQSSGHRIILLRGLGFSPCSDNLH
ncbi:hypothetical protein LIER_40853 [Lithospermum erythrorhizon]|uniref:Uncharacterized protein n=1 Tax=Lithospermum erythrorhizon TaxID=34254 RepID=A0AAV3R4W8_LITER